MPDFWSTSLRNTVKVWKKKFCQNKMVENENLSKDRWKNEISFNSGPGEDGFWRNWAHPQLDYD